MPGGSGTCTKNATNVGEVTAMGKQASVSTPLALLLGLGLMAAPAQAEFFVGGTIGESDIGSYEFDGADVLENDDSDTAYHVFVGWRPLTWLAVTAGYADLGELSAAGDGGGYGEAFTDQIEATAWDLSLIGILPFEQVFGEGGLLSRFSAFAQLGAARWDQDISYMGEFSGPWSGGDDSTNFIYGLGIAFAITERIGVHARYVDYGDIGDEDSDESGHEQDWSMLGLGLTMSFGSAPPPP